MLAVCREQESGNAERAQSASPELHEQPHRGDISRPA